MKRVVAANDNMMQDDRYCKVTVSATNDIKRAVGDLLIQLSVVRNDLVQLQQAIQIGRDYQSMVDSVYVSNPEYYPGFEELSKDDAEKCYDVYNTYVEHCGEFDEMLGDYDRMFECCNQINHILELYSF